MGLSHPPFLQYTKGNMEKKLRTIVALILDQSGSMCTTVAQAVQGYNEQVQQMKLNSKDQEILCCLVTFNGQVYEHQWLVNANELSEAAPEDYITNGSTAMRDAIGYTLDKLIKTTDINDENNAYLVFVVSDGDENASQHYSAGSLRERIQTLQDTKRWTFSYMGCDEKYLKKVAAETAIPVANMAMWSNATPELATRGIKFAAAKMNKYYRERVSGKNCNSRLYSLDDLSSADATDMNVVNYAIANDSNGTVNMNTVSSTVGSTGTKAFCNYSPVSWTI